MFSGATSFYVDPSVVKDSPTISISGVGMYFMYRPSATNNRSGMDYPGINFYLTDAPDDVPNMANQSIYQAIGRVEWNAIQTSSDGSAKTPVNFPTPIPVKTGKKYAIVWYYDGQEDFLPWTNRRGNKLVGTSNVSSGPSSPYGGKYFQYSSILPNTSPVSVDQYQSPWTPIQETDLKFEVYAARYAINSVPVFANAAIPPSTVVYSSNLFYEFDANTNVISIYKPSPRIENITFDRASSLKQAFVGPQKVYQDTVNYPGGGVWASVIAAQSNTVVANSQYSNGSAFNWNDVFQSYSGDKWIIIKDTNKVDVRKVMSVISNTTITINEPLTFSNSASKFMVSPVATIDSFNSSVLDGKNESFLFLRDSSANATVRFVGDSIDISNVTISNGGSNYNNTNILYITGYEYVANAIHGNYAAVANVVTDANGKILTLNWSNTGAGFTNTSGIKIVMAASVPGSVNNSIANTSSGNNLVLTLPVGTVLKTDQTNNIFRQAKPINIEINDILPVMDLQNPTNTYFTSQISTLYYQQPYANSSDGFIYRVGTPQVTTFDMNKRVSFSSSQYLPVIMSRSNEFNALYSNASPNDKVDPLTGYSNCYVLGIQTKSRNDYVALGPFNSPLIEFGRYIINNDYSGEHTDQGNALARHITNVINFTSPTGTARQAEDLKVFVSAWRPVGTDIQVYARIKNSIDTQPLDDGEWTRLDLVEDGTYSTNGPVDLTFGFQASPNTVLSIPGVVAIGNATSNIVGTNTTFTSSIANNDLLKVYDPLFPEQNYAVVLAKEVVNNSLIITDQVFNTNTVLGIGGPELSDRTGLLLDKVGTNGQAFLNSQNDNVVRYYNLSEQIYDNFDMAQIKFVFVTADRKKIPQLAAIRGIALSA